MSFLFPIISSVSIALTCGYLLYKYYIEPNIINLNENTVNIVNEDTVNIVNEDTVNEQKMNRIDKYEYKSLDDIIIEENRPTLIIPKIDKTEYSPIKSSDSDFDIINEDDINNNL